MTKSGEQRFIEARGDSMSQEVFSVPVWVVPLVAAALAGGPIAMGKWIFKRETKRIDDIETDLKKRPKAEEVMSLAKHAEICGIAKKDLQEFIVDQNKEMREYFNVRMENVILKELKKLNGGA